jgi:hypothetical protein
MSLFKLARRLLSVNDARDVWADSAPATTRLGCEQMEDRTTPAVTATVAGGVLTLTNNDAAAEAVSIDTTTTAGFITVLKAAGGTNNVTAGAGTAATGTGAKVAVAGINAINVVNTNAAAATKNTNVTLASIAGATDLRAFTYTSGTGNDAVDLAAAANANVYFKVNLGGGANTFRAADTGVNVLVFTNSAAAASVAVTPSAANSKMALDFRAVTTDVAVNLNVGPNGSLGSYSKMNVTLAAGGDSSKIIGVYGGLGNDTLVGNEADNILLGGGGNDTLIGNGGNDQLNANRDFSPSMPGPTNVAGVATTNANTVIDVSTFAAIAAANAAAPGASPTAVALFNTFGFFSFGEGAAALNGAAGLTGGAGGTLGIDFNTANALVVGGAATEDVLVGGAGNDGLYGFNNTRATATGGIGNDVMSTNFLGLASTFDGGDDNDLLSATAGFTLLGGAGNDNILAAVASATPQTLQTTVVGGLGNDQIDVGNVRNVSIDAGQDLDTVTMPNFSDVAIIHNAQTTMNGGAPAAFANVRRAAR